MRALRRIPCATTFDYEWARVQHTVNCRLAQAVVVPEAIPPERLAALRRHAGQAAPLRGLKEEYYLADFDPDWGGQVVVLPRTSRQRDALEADGGYVVPRAAVDAQSLVAHADVVSSARGTMKREAAAVGTPAWTTFEGRMGAVDARLIEQGPLRRLDDPDEVVLARRPSDAVVAPRVRRDPAVLADLLPSPLSVSSG